LETTNHFAYDPRELRECVKNTIHWFGILNFGRFSNSKCISLLYIEL